MSFTFALRRLCSTTAWAPLTRELAALAPLRRGPRSVPRSGSVSRRAIKPSNRQSSDVKVGAGTPQSGVDGAAGSVVVVVGNGAVIVVIGGLTASFVQYTQAPVPAVCASRSWSYCDQRT